MNRLQLSETWTLGVPVQCVRQRFQYALSVASVNERVGTVQVAQRFCEAMRNFFEDNPSMRRAGNLCPRYSESQLERHVEARRRRLHAIDLDSRKIVK